MPGIDNRVEQTANAYMGNPKALQQKYAQTKDIFDLIALNTINEKVSAASREMRLRAGAEGKPPTLYEKAESQAVDNTKKEMIDEQAGVMQNKLREQQEAQKRLMQTAGAPQPQGVMNAMPQRPPSGGIASVPAPNMQGMASMAGGGIVAFNGETGSAVDGNQGEEEARRAYADRRQNQPPRAEPRSESQSGMQAGLATLLGIRPAEVYRQRLEEVSGGANYSPEERAQKQRQIDEAARFAESSGLKNFLLGMAGRSTPGLAIAGGGSALQNTLNQAMINRHRAEGELIDAGPAARLAGFVRAGEGERTAMTGLAQGTGDAVKLEQLIQQAAARGDPAESKKLAGAARQLSSDSFLKEGSKTLRFLLENGRTDDPLYNKTLADMEARQNQIYKLWKIDNPEIPMPSQSAPPAAPPPNTRSLWTPDLGAIFGRNAPEPTGARRAPPTSGGVDYSNPRLRDN